MAKLTIKIKQPPKVEMPSIGMMYLPNYLETLDWEWDNINYQVICTPDGAQQLFVEWCVGWGKSDEVSNS